MIHNQNDNRLLPKNLNEARRDENTKLIDIFKKENIGNGKIRIIKSH